MLQRRTAAGRNRRRAGNCLIQVILIRRKLVARCDASHKKPKNTKFSGFSSIEIVQPGSLVADPDAAQTPAVAVPDPLAAPPAVRTVIDRGRRAIVVAGTAVIAVLRGDAADDGAGREAPDDAGGDASAARFGRLRSGHGRDRQGRGGCE